MLRPFALATPEGEASPVLDVGSGQRLAKTRLWGGVDLRFWVKPRRLLGDIVLWDLSGTLPPEMRADDGPHSIEGATNVPEAAVTLLGATSHTLFHYVVIVASNGRRDEQDVRARTMLFVRARRIRRQLESISKEKHDGRYKQLALTAAVMLAGDQRLAEVALGINSGDWDESAQ